MRESLAFVIFVLVVVPLVKIAWRSYRRAHVTVGEQLSRLADEAVRDAKTNGVNLDYSTGSIKEVEGLLGKIHERYSTSPSSVDVRSFAISYGAYIGEAIRRNDPICKDDPDCRWERDHKLGGPISYPLHWQGSDSFPTAWCFRRITDGDGDNVWIKYTVLRDRKLRVPTK
jgi:hypothetical protein